jgi:hypothetical protein
VDGGTSAKTTGLACKSASAGLYPRHPKQQNVLLCGGRKTAAREKLFHLDGRVTLSLPGHDEE